MSKPSRKQAAGRQRVSAAFGRVANGVQVPIMSLSAIMRAGEAAIAAGADDAALDAAVKAAVDKARAPQIGCGPSGVRLAGTPSPKPVP